MNRFFTFFLWATSVFGAEAPQDPLWQKAVAVAERHKDWVPGLVVTRSEVLFKGEPQGVHEMWQRSTLGERGEMVTETVKVLEDGKDVTKRQKAEEAKANRKAKSEKPGGGTGGINPFDVEAQDRVTLKATNGSRAIQDRTCVGYVFEVKGEKGPSVKGTAWLEKVTGVPMEIEKMTLDPLPDKHLKQMTFTTRYEIATNGVWQVKAIETTGTVSVMFIKGNVRSTTTFSEYWKRPPN